MNEVKSELKSELVSLIDEKKQNTVHRLTLKRIPFSERTGVQHGSMLGCWDIGRELKGRIRVVGLAYAFLRGQRYWHVERHTEKSIKASWISNHLGCDITLVEAWLAARPSEEELAAWEEHLRQAKEKGTLKLQTRKAASSLPVERVIFLFFYMRRGREHRYTYRFRHVLGPPFHPTHLTPSFGFRRPAHAIGLPTYECLLSRLARLRGIGVALQHVALDAAEGQVLVGPGAELRQRDDVVEAGLHEDQPLVAVGTGDAAPDAPLTEKASSNRSRVHLAPPFASSA